MVYGSLVGIGITGVPKGNISYRVDNDDRKKSNKKLLLADKRLGGLWGVKNNVQKEICDLQTRLVFCPHCRTEFYKWYPFQVIVLVIFSNVYTAYKYFNIGHNIFILN